MPGREKIKQQCFIIAAAAVAVSPRGLQSATRSPEGHPLITPLHQSISRPFAVFFCLSRARKSYGDNASICRGVAGPGAGLQAPGTRGDGQEEPRHSCSRGSDARRDDAQRDDGGGACDDRPPGSPLSLARTLLHPTQAGQVDLYCLRYRARLYRRGCSNSPNLRGDWRYGAPRLLHLLEK